MPTCKEVSREVSSGEIEVAAWYQRLGCWLHLLMCPRCREYSEQIHELGEAMRQQAAEPDADRLAELESKILAEID